MAMRSAGASGLAPASHFVGSGTDNVIERVIDVDCVAFVIGTPEEGA